MSEKESERAERAEKLEGGKLGFVSSLGRLFRGKQAAPAAAAQPASGFSRLEADFEAAIRGLNDRIEEQRRAAAEASPGRASAGGTSAEQRALEQQRRATASHRAIRDDIEKMHVRLRTGISGADMDALSDFLSELDGIAAAGRDSQELIPRARHAITERLRVEAGELAVSRLIALLEREALGWPDPTSAHSKETPERIEASRRRRLADVRESFLNQDLRRSAERLQGIVRGWGGDYPDPGTPLWEETVLEGVGAALRGRLLRQFVEVLREDREQLLSRTEDSVGKQLAVLTSTLEGGVHSVEQARLAVASSLRVLDEVVPEIAWEIVRSRVAEARGEFPQP